MSQRLFVALRPPEAALDVLVDTMEGLDNARWQSVEQMHLTLRFVGEVDRRTAEDLAAALAPIRSTPFMVTMRGTGHFARRGRAHTLYAAIERTRTLIDLQKSIERACQRAGLPPETRAFTPHVTIARLGGMAGDLGGWLHTHETFGPVEWYADHFGLFESYLSRNGSIYEEIANYPLTPA